MFNSYNYGQISVGKIGKEKKTSNINKVTSYDSLGGYIDYNSFYSSSPYNEIPNNERPTVQEFYTRYYNLEVYYPMYPSNYRKGEIFIFQINDSIKLLDRTDIGEKYFTIECIYLSFDELKLTDSLKFNNIQIPSSIFGGLIYKLKEKNNQEITYVIGGTFILTSYYTKIDNTIKANTFVAKKYYNGKKVPISDDYVPIEKGSEWTGKLTLLREKDLWMDYDLNSYDAFDIKYMVILNNGKDTILVYLSKDDNYENLQSMFVTKEFQKQQKQKANNESKKQLEILTKKYGEKYAKLISQKKVKIGMTKEMCLAAWGPTLNRRKYTDSSGEIEVWKYLGLGKLFFKNGKLYSIINY